MYDSKNVYEKQKLNPSFNMQSKKKWPVNLYLFMELRFKNPTHY